MAKLKQIRWLVVISFIALAVSLVLVFFNGALATVIALTAVTLAVLSLRE